MRTKKAVRPLRAINFTKPEGKAEKAVRRFFDRAGDLYLNPHNVQFAWLWKDAIYINAHWNFDSDQEKVDIDIGVELDSYKAFARMMGITGKTSEAINQLTPEHLIIWFRCGKADMLCSINRDIGQSLSFKFKKNKLTATDSGEKEHTIDLFFESPDLIINFTKNYFAKHTNF